MLNGLGSSPWALEGFHARNVFSWYHYFFCKQDDLALCTCLSLPFLNDRKYYLLCVNPTYAMCLLLLILSYVTYASYYSYYDRKYYLVVSFFNKLIYFAFSTNNYVSVLILLGWPSNSSRVHWNCQLSSERWYHNSRWALGYQNLRGHLQFPRVSAE